MEKMNMPVHVTGKAYIIMGSDMPQLQEWESNLIVLSIGSLEIWNIVLYNTYYLYYMYPVVYII
jgi:hypothetical protein